MSDAVTTAHGTSLHAALLGFASARLDEAFPAPPAPPARVLLGDSETAPAV